MERRRQRLALAYQHRICTFGRDHFHILADTFDLRSADEDHLNRLVKKPAFADRAVDLASVSIAPHGDIERAESGLLWILHFCSEQDASRAGAKSRFCVDE